MAFNDNQYDGGPLKQAERRITELSAYPGPSGLPQLGGIAAQQSFAQTHVTVPMTADNWRKLSRETQIRVLEETGVLKAAQREQV